MLSDVLQRLEADEDIRVGYQDIEVLARFYGVSTDFLFGLTDNEKSIADMKLTNFGLPMLLWMF